MVVVVVVMVMIVVAVAVPVAAVVMMFVFLRLEEPAARSQHFGWIPNRPAPAKNVTRTARSADARCFC